MKNDLISRRAAIRWVKTECNPYGKPTLDYESGKKVIEHLEAMPSAQPDHSGDVNGKVDLIDRQAAIDALKMISFSHWFECGEYLSEDTREIEIINSKKALEVIEALPSAQPEQDWIPCSVRLPEELEEVNVTWINHCPESYYDFVKGKPFTGSAVYYKEKWYWYSSTCTDVLGEYGENDIDEVDDAIEIIAWKPFGEPWKGEQNE